MQRRAHPAYAARALNRTACNRKQSVRNDRYHTQKGRLLVHLRCGRERTVGREPQQSCQILDRSLVVASGSMRAPFRMAEVEDEVARLLARLELSQWHERLGSSGGIRWAISGC